MALTVEEWPINRLIPYEKNPRKNDHAIERMAQAITEFGFRIPIVAKSDGSVVDGHLRLKAGLQLGLTTVPVALADDLTPTQIKAFRLLANRSASWAEWNDELLLDELTALQTDGFDLGLTGFDTFELDAMFAPKDTVDPIDEGTEPADANSGVLLSRINITIDDPIHVVIRGDHFILAERHHLFCVSVMKDWNRWLPFLINDAIFCPYPGPFVPYGLTAEKYPLVMVQSDPYMAGHLLDRYLDCHGPGSIQRMAVVS